MSAAFVLTRRAEQDLDDIWEYIARDSPQAADKVLNSIERMCDRLARNPMLGHLRQDVADDRHRFRLVYSYLIVYGRQGAKTQRGDGDYIMQIRQPVGQARRQVLVQDEAQPADRTLLPNSAA